MTTSDRLVNAVEGSEDAVVDRAIRPRKLDEYVGQPVVREQMDVFINAARGRSEALDHVLDRKSVV